MEITQRSGERSDMLYWFEVMPEPIKLKKRNLINTWKPVAFSGFPFPHHHTKYETRTAPMLKFVEFLYDTPHKIIC